MPYVLKQADLSVFIQRCDQDTPTLSTAVKQMGGARREKPSVDALNRDLPAIKISSSPQSQKYLLFGTIFKGKKTTAPYPINVVFNTLQYNGRIWTDFTFGPL